MAQYIARHCHIESQFA